MVEPRCVICLRGVEGLVAGICGECRPALAELQAASLAASREAARVAAFDARRKRNERTCFVLGFIFGALFSAAGNPGGSWPMMVLMGVLLGFCSAGFVAPWFD